MQRRAQAKAAELGISFAEYVRRLVSQDLGQPQDHAYDIREIFDLVTEGPPTNIAREKRKLAGDAALATYLRKKPRKLSHSKP